MPVRRPASQFIHRYSPLLYPLRAAPLVFFDLGTTGLRTDRGGRIREIAVVDHDGIRFDWKSPGDDPPDRAVARQLPRLLDVLPDQVVVGHNLSFDFRFVTYECRRLSVPNHPGLDLRYLDPLGLARSLLDAPSGCALGPLLAHFGSAPDEELHTAVGDALATRPLFWHLVEGSVRERRLCSEQNPLVRLDNLELLPGGPVILLAYILRKHHLPPARQSGRRH